jgi:hypothetical protein
MKVYWTRIRIESRPGYVYYFKGNNMMTAIFIKGVNKKRRPEYLFLNSVPYTCDIEFSESRVFENKIKDKQL